MIRIFYDLPFFSLTFLSVVQLVFSLMCYTCNQRVQNAYACRTQVVEDCSVSYPGKQVICIRNVQRWFDGSPPWVFSQCYALGMPTDPLLNQCQLSEVKGRSEVVLYTLEICSCSQNLCNGGAGFGGTPAPSQPGLGVILPPSLPIISGLTCYKCNQRFQSTFACRDPSIENCAFVLPGQEAVCARRVQIFSTGEAPWVFAQCEPKFGAMAAAASPVGVPVGYDACNTENNVFYSIETCVCSTPLCNNVGTSPQTLPVVIGNPLAQIIPFGPFQLRCYRCSERIANGTTCVNQSIDDCSILYPNQPVACTRSVQIFSDGQAPWVVERCGARALFPEARPNDCWLQPLTGSNSTNGTDYLEFCTCITDLCNTDAIMNNLMIGVG